MTIIEAIKSGKPFRRIEEKDWMVVDDDGYFKVLSDGLRDGMTTWLFPESIIANDWEIKQ